MTWTQIISRARLLIKKLITTLGNEYCLSNQKVSTLRVLLQQNFTTTYKVGVIIILYFTDEEIETQNI